MSFNNTNTDILIAGAAAALSIDLLVYPLDTIKTRFQSPDCKRLYINQASNTWNRALFRGLYQGVGSVVLATVPSSGAFFTTYEGSKALLHRINPVVFGDRRLLPTPVVHSLASCIGELVSCFILTPAEVLKQNAQMVKRSADSQTRAFDTTATRQALAKFKKPTQLWRGYTALVARNLPFTGMQFPMFESLKRQAIERRKAKGKFSGSLLEKATITATAAGSAGSLAAVITTPIDVVKTRIMLNASNEDVTSSKDSAKTSQVGQTEKTSTQQERASLKQSARSGRTGGFQVGQEILRTEGVKGLFRGALLRGGWTALGSGLYLGIYESGRTYLEGRRTGQRDGVDIE